MIVATQIGYIHRVTTIRLIDFIDSLLSPLLRGGPFDIQGGGGLCILLGVR